MSLLDKVKKKLKELKIPYEYVELSPRPDKKIRIVINGKSIHFGAKNSYTFLEGNSEQVRNAYRARHFRIKTKDGRYAVTIPYSPAYLSYWVLWS